MKEKEFYIKIQLYLKLTQFSYSDYIKNEKKFIYTKVLRKFNDSFSGLNETYSTSHDRTLFTGEVFCVFIVSYTSFFM